MKYNLLTLSIALARAEFKLKNEGSYLGLLWYIIGPVLFFLLLLVVFSKELGHSIPFYPLYLLLGLIMFNYFRSVTIESTRIIYDHRLIVKSINFPYQALVGSVVLRTLLSHILEVFVFLCILLFFDVPRINILIYPIILLSLAGFTYGLSLILAAITILFRDFEHIWNFFAQLLWFATPIFYSMENHGYLELLNLLNPIYYFITIAREIIIYGNMPQTFLIVGSLFYTTLTLIIGQILFKKLKHKFTEVI